MSLTCGHSCVTTCGPTWQLTLLSKHEDIISQPATGRLRSPRSLRRGNLDRRDQVTNSKSARATPNSARTGSSHSWSKNRLANKTLPSTTKVVDLDQHRKCTARFSMANTLYQRCIKYVWSYRSMCQMKLKLFCNRPHEIDSNDKTVGNTQQQHAFTSHSKTYVIQNNWQPAKVDNVLS